MDDGFGTIILVFLVVLFFLWLLTGGPSHQSATHPFEKPYTEQIAPNETFVPTKATVN